MDGTSGVLMSGHIAIPMTTFKVTAAAPIPAEQSALRTNFAVAQ